MHWNMIFPVLSKNIAFLFPKNMILFLRQKMKDHLSEKRGIDVFYILGKDGIYFSCKFDIILL